MLEPKKRVAIYGGAFDPPHLGHMQVAHLATDYVDEVWVMPCFSHMHNKKMTPDQHRVIMCANMIEELMASKGLTSKVVLSTFETQNELCGGTYLTMLKLKEEFPNDEFLILIGQDNAETINTWRNWEKLVAEFDFLVVPRGDSAKFELPTKNSLVLSGKKTAPCSSSQIRKEIAAGIYNETFLSPSVKDYIVSEHLYV